MHDLSWCRQSTLRTTCWSDVQHSVSSPVRSALDKVLDTHNGASLSREECLLLAHATGDDLFGLVVAANELRRQMVGDTVTYVVTRNINFTNVCIVGCKFCAFAVGPRHETAYFLSLDELADKVREAARWGATEVCIQGGLPRDLPPFYYRDILRGGEGCGAGNALPRFLADGDALRRGADRHAGARVPADAEGRGAGYAARHRGRDSRR